MNTSCFLLITLSFLELPRVECMTEMLTLYKYFKNEIPSKLQANQHLANQHLTVHDIESANREVKNDTDNFKTLPGKKPKISYVANSHS